MWRLSPPPTSHTLPVLTTASHAHLLLPQVTEEPGLLPVGRGRPCPQSSRILTHHVLPLPESSVSFSLGSLPPCLQPHPTLNPVRTEACFHPSPPPLYSPPPTPHNTEQFITLHSLSLHPYKANSGRREVHDSYNLW